MIYNVLPGDSIAAEFKKTSIKGKTIVCRECLVVGDVNADSLPEFWDQRALFVHTEYGEDEIEYHDRVAEELGRLLDLDDDEVHLWFEYELFCSVNMWFCLWLLNETAASVYRVEPIILSEADRWNGFGKMDAGDLNRCYDARIPFAHEDIALGADLWNAYRKGNIDRLMELGNTASACFPYLKEVTQAAANKDHRPSEILAEIQFEGKKGIDEIFPEFSRRAGIYGFGDLQVERLIDKN